MSAAQNATATDPVSARPPMPENFAGDRDVERSAELLRLALPMITRHGRGFAPISYAVWYEYVRGSNQELRDELDELVRNNRRLTESNTFEIYQRHVVDKMEQAMRDGRESLLGLMNQVDDSVRAAATSTLRFDGKLGGFTMAIDSDPTPEEMKRHVSSLRNEIREVNSNMCTLQDNLQAARSDMQRLADELIRAKEEAQLDPLTGLLNRRGFDIALSAQIDRAVNREKSDAGPLTLILLDIDHFKAVNDRYGHLFGDKVIQGLARVMDGAVMKKDFVSRYGGEEFAIILPDTDAGGGRAVAERIRDAVSQSRIRRANANDTISNISISAGLAVLKPGETMDALIERADRALYAAKAGGRNRVVTA